MASGGQRPLFLEGVATASQYQQPEGDFEWQKCAFNVDPWNLAALCTVWSQMKCLRFQQAKVEWNCMLQEAGGLAHTLQMMAQGASCHRMSGMRNSRMHGGTAAHGECEFQ